jgi:hypothetical protein
MRAFFLAFAFLSTSFGINASGTVDFLEVDNDVVLFSTSAAKAAASPACVAPETSSLWTVSLTSDSGRAIYSLILTSMAKGDGVALNIESAQDCTDKSGFERASKVSLIVNSGNNSISSYGIKLAPDLDFPSTRLSDKQTLEKIDIAVTGGELTEVLSLTSKQVLSYLNVTGIDASNETKIRLSIDGQIIFDDVIKDDKSMLISTGELIVIDNSLVLEVETVLSQPVWVVFQTRPIQ